MQEHADPPLPAHLRHVLANVHEDVRAIEQRIAALEREQRGLCSEDDDRLDPPFLD